MDLRDKTSNAQMMREVLKEYNVAGTKVYADNAFVSVDQLRWCRENDINLCGTTRRSFGFPDALQFTDMQLGEYDWLMTKDGFLDMEWKDVGNTKGM